MKNYGLRITCIIGKKLLAKRILARGFFNRRGRRGYRRGKEGK